MPDKKSDNSDLPVTKADLDRAMVSSKNNFKQLITATEGRIEQLLADQAEVILEAVDERLDKKLDEKFDTVITKLDGVMGGIDALQQENVVGAEQLRRRSGSRLAEAYGVARVGHAGGGTSSPLDTLRAKCRRC